MANRLAAKDSMGCVKFIIAYGVFIALVGWHKKRVRKNSIKVGQKGEILIFFHIFVKRICGCKFVIERTL